MTTDRRPPTLRHRLLVAFFLVSAASVLTVVAVGLLGTASDLHRMVAGERQRTASDIERILTAGFSGDWAHTDVAAAERRAWQMGAQITVYGPDGQPVAGANPTASYLAGSASRTEAIRVHGQGVGSVRLWFSDDTWMNPQARGVILLWALRSALIAAAVAAVASILVSRGLARPLRRITATAGKIRRGQRDVRCEQRGGEPREITVLADALNEMADRLVGEYDRYRQLSADIAHELRTPLAALQAELEELRDGLVAPDSARLTALHADSLQLAQVVDDLAALASAEAASRSLAREPTDLALIAGHAAQGRGAVLRAAKLHLDLRLHSAPVLGDPARLHQVVGILLDNAARFCRPGDRVVVTTGRVQGEAVLTVSDTGPGIAPADLPHVLDRLYRGANARELPGSGIGLAVARELVSAHGGRITVDSHEGETTVRIALPLARHPSGRQRVREAPQAAAAG